MGGAARKRVRMSRRVFVLVADWPFEQLTDIGKLTYCCTGGTENHMGLFIPCCTAEEVAAHSAQAVSHPSARDEAHVAFDYMADLLPRFQSWENPQYYNKQANVWLYPVLDVDAAAVHAACLEVAQARPSNNCCHRWSPVWWCWPWHCCPSNTDRVDQSTCVALSLRILAQAQAESRRAYTSDAFVFETLGLARFGCAHPWAPRLLSGHTPRSALEALQEAGVVGRPLRGFPAAIAQCRGGGAGVPLGSVLPLLSLCDR